MSAIPPKPFKDERPWGDFVEFSKNEISTVKIITVKAHEALSLQSHSFRDEFWHVIEGIGTVEIGDKKEDAIPKKEFFVPRGTKHRITAGDVPLSILEIAFGAFNENDIVRYDDRYGRVSK